MVPLDSTSRSPARADQRQMRPGSGSAPTPPGLRSTMPGSPASRNPRPHAHRRRGERRRARLRRRQRHPRGHGCAPSRDGAVNERLSNDLRPTLFLAQLPNLVRRQHLDRPQGHRLVAHASRRGERRVSAVEIASADRRRPGRHLPRRRQPDRRAQGHPPHPRRRRLGLEGSADFRLGPPREGRRRHRRLGRGVPL